MSASSSKKIISHGGIYLIGTILQRCVSLVMLPIYTRCLTPSDYGIIELLSMTLDFVGIILGMRIGQALFRFYHEYKEQKDRGEVISTAVYLVVGLNLFGVLIIGLFSHSLSALIFDDLSQVRNLMLFSLCLLGAGFIEIPMTYIRAQQRPWLFVMFSALKLITQLSLNIYFVVYLRLHVEGVIYSAILSSLFIGSMLAGYTAMSCGVRFSIEKMKKLVSFSLPLMLTSMLAFYITFGDRYFLKVYSGIHEVGIYSLAYKFGFLLSGFIVQPFMNIWDSEKYIIYKNGNKSNQYNRIFQSYNVVIFIAVLCITLFVKDLLALMSEESFWPAYRFVPVIIAAYTINSWAGFVNIGVLIHEKTIEITYGAVIATVVITFGYVFLIPRFGGLGAAWASLIAFAAAFMWVYFRSKRLYDMQLQWRNILVFGCLVIMANILSMLAPDTIVESLVFNFMIFIIFSLAIVSIIAEYRSIIIVCLKSPSNLLRIKKLFSQNNI